jgi:hypothetical protein
MLCTRLAPRTFAIEMTFCASWTSPIEHRCIYKEYRTGASPIEHRCIYKEYRTGAGASGDEEGAG